ITVQNGSAHPVPEELATSTLTMPGKPATATITAQNGSAHPEPEEPTSAEENTTMRPDTPATDESFRSFVSSLEERVGADRQCHVHEQVRYRLIAELHGARLAPSQSPLADITCKGPRGAVLYEVLGEGGHTYERMREAVLRIMEVEHVGGDRAEHLFLVLPQAPEPAWAPAMLTTAFDIATIWRDGTGWAGEDLATALGQAPG
ncbi:hypothetical protein ABZ260_50320, partial [Streptosporangium sp. NPDC006013]|uniref:hypothetical protein n=1 Tax=Streptosporangium sp. NPDC006013 TaxID=3155596 RepID=UPI0033A78462